jgi:hypothetical protein
MAWLVSILALSAGAVAALSLSRGQEKSSVSPTPPEPQSRRVSTVHASGRPHVNFGKLLPLHKQFYLSAQGGANWLSRANLPEGRFIHGFVPDLNTRLEGDHYLRQVAAAFALARAARFTGNDEYRAKAQQTISVLLLDTTVDPKDNTQRYTSLPSMVLNRLATAGLLVMAINELPSPGVELLEQSEQLCGYIRKQQQPDGSLNFRDEAKDKQAMVDLDGINYYPGEALYGLMLSQRHKAATWKIDVLRKAVKFYLPWWRDHKSMAMVPWHTAAYTAAYLLTREQVFADCVTEMNDWLCGLQYVQLERRHPFWVGGFMSWENGKVIPTAPDVGSAAYAEGLTEACRVVSQAGDLQRYNRYREAIEQCLRYLTMLQYTEANTGHFADWYRPALLGGFHASFQDGSLRIDFTQHALCALVQYLTYVAKVGG